MTLIDAFKVPCTKVIRERVPDGEGGWNTTWIDGEGFEAAIVLASRTNVLIAEAHGLTGFYTVTADRELELAFHDVFRRETDGKTFRIMKVYDPTPDVASFQFSQYQAEEWELA